MFWKNPKSEFYIWYSVTSVLVLSAHIGIDPSAISFFLFLNLAHISHCSCSSNAILLTALGQVVGQKNSRRSLATKCPFILRPVHVACWWSTGHKKGFCSSASFLPCLNYCKNAPLYFTYLSPTPHKLSNRQLRQVNE